MRKLVGLMFCVAVLAMPAQKGFAGQDEGPFGLEMGVSVDSVGRVVRLSPDAKNPGRYTANSAPVSNEAFDLYEFTFGDESGLCQVGAYSRTLGQRSAGHLFDEIYSVLVDKYGKPSRPDSGGAALWIQQKLPNNLRLIGVQRIDIDMGREAFVHITYSFDNLPNCSSPTEVDRKGL